MIETTNLFTMVKKIVIFIRLLLRLRSLKTNLKYFLLSPRTFEMSHKMIFNFFCYKTARTYEESHNNFFSVMKQLVRTELFHMRLLAQSFVHKFFYVKIFRIFSFFKKIMIMRLVVRHSTGSQITGHRYKGSFQ